MKRQPLGWWKPNRCLRESLVYDALFDAWRSTVSGHRVANAEDWTKPTATRWLVLRRPWLAPMEILHRWVARRNNPDRLLKG
jgi:hypothetical protein